MRLCMGPQSLPCPLGSFRHTGEVPFEFIEIEHERRSRDLLFPFRAPDILGLFFRIQ